MKELTCQFGQNRQLAGIITEPRVRARRVAVVLVSAGLLPKSGPFRLYAEVARRLSSEGFLTLRFDLGNIGDSRQEHPNVPLARRTRFEIEAALDYLTAHYELDGIVLGGLCSGAEDSFRSAEIDQRVGGVVMIDPFAYRTSGFMWRHVLYRAMRRCRRALGLYRPISREANGRHSLVTYRYMEHTESSRILRALVKRKVHVHFLYTGGAREVFNHERQLEKMFGDVDFAGKVTLDHFPQMEHTPVFEEDRRTLVEAIAHRLASAYPVGDEAREAS